MWPSNASEREMGGVQPGNDGRRIRNPVPHQPAASLLPVRTNRLAWTAWVDGLSALFMSKGNRYWQATASGGLASQRDGTVLLSAVEKSTSRRMPVVMTM